MKAGVIILGSDWIIYKYVYLFFRLLEFVEMILIRIINGG